MNFPLNGFWTLFSYTNILQNVTNVKEIVLHLWFVKKKYSNFLRLPPWDVVIKAHDIPPQVILDTLKACVWLWRPLHYKKNTMKPQERRLNKRIIHTYVYTIYTRLKVKFAWTRVFRETCPSTWKNSLQICSKVCQETTK